MSTAPSPVLFVVRAVVAIPATVLIHELGHAAVARFLSGRPVAVQVGGVAIRLGLSRFRMVIGSRKGLGPAAGIAVYDAREVTAVGALMIAVAGPAASALGALCTGRLLSALGAHGLMHALLWVATCEGWSGAIINILPMSISQRRGAPAVATDGLRALQAARLIGKARS